MKYLSSLASKILTFILLIFFIFIAIKNYHGVDLNFTSSLSLSSVPLFLVIFISFVCGSLVNLVFLILNRRKR